MQMLRNCAHGCLLFAGFGFALTALTPAAPAQSLRRAVAAADLLVIATAVRVVPTKTHVIHRLKIEEVLRGPAKFDSARPVSVLITKRVSVHNRPVPAKRMLYCLHDHGHIAKRLPLPRSYAPYYKMSGYPGSAVQLSVGDPRLAYARVLVAAQRGAAPRTTAEKLYEITLRGDPRVRTEAAASLSERRVLLDNLTDLHLSQVLSKAAGETVDVRYKIALASICATRKLAATVPTLALSAEHVGDVSFLQALGRFARYIHGDRAAEALAVHVRRAKGTTKARLILAMGATETEAALDKLLAMRQRGQNLIAVDAALRVHGSPRAAAAIARKTRENRRPGNNGKK